jgi:hypothetical protein
MKIANSFRNVFGKIKETQGSLIPRIFLIKKTPHKASLFSKVYFMKKPPISFQNVFEKNGNSRFFDSENF